MGKLFETEQAQPKKKSNEWYTPAKYIEAARTVMGGIDLDPASCDVANLTVKATRYYTQDDDGLSKLWYGNVYCNPPFTTQARNKGGLFKSGMGLFCAKLIQEYQCGNVQQAILLTMPNTQTRWFQPLWNYPICFTGHSLKFEGPRRFPDKRNQAMFGTIFVYLGPNEAKFVEIFSQFGRIAKAIDTPPAKPTMRELWEVSA